MGDLKPLGSEKLQGMDKIKRILEIAKYNETPKQNINELNTTNYTIQLADGLTYGIVKEKLGYIIKKGLNESTLDYADQMRQRKYFRSYSEAMKKLNLTAIQTSSRILKRTLRARTQRRSALSAARMSSEICF